MTYQTECFYDPDTDHRRKGALRKEIRQLREGKAEQNCILEAIRTGSEADVDDVVQMIRANPDEPYESIAENLKKLCIGSGKRPEAPILERELAEFGKVTINQTRHYGHTSNLTMVGTEDDLPVMPVEQCITWTSVTGDIELINHLFNLYFSWAHPFYLLFSEEIFFHGLNDNKLKYCSPMLVNSVLALACNYSDRPEALADPHDPTTAGDHFFAEAQRLLAEDEHCCITTIQALGVMSIRQAMNGHDSSGWRFVSLMMGMAAELGLHMQYPMQPNARVTTGEIEARRITFWGCFVVQTAWAVCVGRLAILPRAGIQLSEPIITDNLESKVWKPYGDPRFLRGSVDFEQPSFTYTLLVQLSRLSKIVNDTNQMFYAPTDRITSRKLQKFHEKFQEWYGDLPAVFAIKRDGATLPQVITLQ
jgi:hypothetical protein